MASNDGTSRPAHAPHRRAHPAHHARRIAGGVTFASLLAFTGVFAATTHPASSTSASSGSSTGSSTVTSDTSVSER